MSNYPFSETCPPPNTSPIFSSTAIFPFGATHFTLYPWKQVQQCNIVNMYVSMQTNLSTQVIQTNSSGQSNIIVINASCDPTINTCKKFVAKNDTIKQTNLVDMDAVQRSYTSNNIQQLLNMNMIAMLSSVTKALTIMPSLPTVDPSAGGSQSMTNIINSFTRVGISVNTHIEQDCQLTQSNYLEVNINDYGTVKLNHLVIKQTNKANMKCTQNAIVGNNVLQTITDNLTQISGDPFEMGRGSRASLVSMIIVLILFLFILFLGFFLLMVIMKYGGWGFIGISFFFFIFFFIYQPVKGSWYGFSPGIPNSACANHYTATKTNKYYDSPVQAKNECMKDPNCVAVDYVIDQDSVTKENPQAGHATFYSGNIDNFSKCTDITDSGEDTAMDLVQLRNPWYRNAELAGVSPDDSIEGDVLLDVTSGNLWYRLPLNSYKGQRTEWVQPSMINRNNKNNVLSGNSYFPCASNQKEPITVGNKTGKVYIFIDYDMDETLLMDPKTGQIHSYPLPPKQGKYINPIDKNAAQDDSKSYDTTSNPSQDIGPEDYFLVAYPMGCSDQPPVKERYFYNQQFFLYKTKYNDTQTAKLHKGWYPDWGLTQENEPLNIVNGYGIVPDVFQFDSTFLKFKQKNYWFLWIGLYLFVFGIILIGLEQWRNSVKEKVDEKSFEFSSSDDMFKKISELTETKSPITIK